MKRTPVGLAFVLLLAAGATEAKLPPLSPEAQLKADEAKARTAWTDKVAAYQLCKSMDRVAAHYQKTAKAQGKEAPAPVATPPCTEPGPFVAASPTDKKPLEASGAHSPPATAATPPSTKPTQAELQGKTK